MLESLREQVSSACLLMRDYGLASFAWGNISAIDRANSLIVIKPKGTPCYQASPERMIITDLSGNIVEGDGLPSPDLPAHIELYKSFPKADAIVHTHSPNATVWAQAGRDIPPYGVTHAEYFKGCIPCTLSLSSSEIEDNYEQKAGLSVVEAFEKRGLDPETIPGALIFNHGPIAWGRDALEALKNAAILETVAKLAYQTEQINPEIMPIGNAILDQRFFKHHK